MKIILVIGNGFDLEHGLRTSYRDFIDFCATIKDLTIQDVNIMEVCIDEFSNSKNIEKFFWKDCISEEVRSNFQNFCQNNFWLDYIIDKHKNDKEGSWCDIEYIISNIIESLSYIYNHLEEVEQGKFLYYKNFDIVRLLQSKLNNIVGDNKYYKIKRLKKKFYDDLDELIYMLEVYLEVISYEISIERKRLFELIPVNYLISFNYTDVSIKEYKTYWDLSHDNIHFIHGQAKLNKITDNNMVFGIGKDIEESGPNDQYEYIEFQKYYQRIIKQTGVKYKDWISKHEESFSNGPLVIFIYGHSLDYTDGDVIKDLINCKSSILYIFYIDSNSLKSLVLNLVKILSKEELIELTSNGKINFIHKDDINYVAKLLAI